MKGSGTSKLVCSTFKIQKYWGIAPTSGLDGGDSEEDVGEKSGEEEKQIGRGSGIRSGRI